MPNDAHTAWNARHVQKVCIVNSCFKHQVSYVVLASLQWNMTNFMWSSDTQLAEHLGRRLTLTLTSDPSNPTCVFKWLRAADQWQLDQLRGVCITALGTYLLPFAHQSLAAHKEALSALYGPTAAATMFATVRCAKCLNNAATVTNWCDGRCPGRNINNLTQSLRGCSVFERCNVCAFTGSAAPPGKFVANICGYCNKLRSWA